MAHVHIPESNRDIAEPTEISSFLGQFGIIYERWNVEREISPDADQEQILAAYKPEIDRVAARGGYVTADVINVSPDTPGLQMMLDKFNKEHRHDDDEVRFCVKGRGVFYINPVTHPVFSISVEAGDLISVPAGTRHWFELCTDRCIRAVRLFVDKSGWTPHYVDGGVHAGFEPVCWGTSYIPRKTAGEFTPAISI